MKVVASVVSTKGKIMNVLGDMMSRVLPRPLGQFSNVAEKEWGAVGNIADNVAKL